MYVCSIDFILLVVNVHKRDGCLTSGANPDLTPCSAGSDLVSTRFAQVCMSQYLGKEMMVVTFTGKCCSNLKQFVTCMFLIWILWTNRGTLLHSQLIFPKLFNYHW